MFDTPWIWFSRYSRHLLDILDLSWKSKNFYIQDIFESSSKCFREQPTFARKNYHINILFDLNKRVAKKCYFQYTVEPTFLTTKAFEIQYVICFCCCLSVTSSCKVIHIMLFEHQATTANCSSKLHM